MVKNSGISSFMRVAIFTKVSGTYRWMITRPVYLLTAYLSYSLSKLPQAASLLTCVLESEAPVTLTRDVVMFLFGGQNVQLMA
jgi:riboflavin transporter FmnP